MSQGVPNDDGGVRKSIEKMHQAAGIAPVNADNIPQGKTNVEKFKEYIQRPRLKRGDQRERPQPH